MTEVAPEGVTLNVFEAAMKKHSEKIEDQGSQIGGLHDRVEVLENKMTDLGDGDDVADQSLSRLSILIEQMNKHIQNTDRVV